MKTGLILEGGAMRGLFTAGVIDVLMEAGITFNGMIGVSAGAAFGCNYKSKQPGRVLRYNLRYCKDKRFCSFRSLLRTGDLYGADFCYREIPEKLDIFDDQTFRENPMEFHLVCTDLATGEAIYKQLGDDDTDMMNWFRASASMPLVSNPVEIDGMHLLDGGIADSIPLEYFEKLGYNRNVVVLTRPAEYRKKKNSLQPLMRFLLRKYPKVVAAMAKRHEVYNQTLDEIEKKERAGEILVIRPPVALDVGHVEHNRKKLQQAYDCGRKTATEQLEAVRSFLKGEGK